MIKGDKVQFWITHSSARQLITGTVDGFHPITGYACVKINDQYSMWISKDRLKLISEVANDK